MNRKSVLSALTAAMVLSCTYLPSSAPAVHGTVYAESEDLTLNVNKENNQIKGTTDDGFKYDVWIEKGKDITGSAAIRKDGTMSTEWNARKSAGDFLFLYGLDYNSGTDPLKQGEISVNYEADYAVGENGNSQLGVRGWLGPRDEFYIIDDWVNWRPADGNCKTALIDGGEYDIFFFTTNERRIPSCAVRT